MCARCLCRRGRVTESLCRRETVTLSQAPPLVVPRKCKFTELLLSLLVRFERVKVVFESLNALLELVLLENDLTQLPGAVHRDVRLLVDVLGHELLKHLVRD